MVAVTQYGHNNLELFFRMPDRYTTIAPRSYIIAEKEKIVFGELGKVLGESPQKNDMDGLVDAFKHNKRFRQMGENLARNW